jgi:plastocyanin domain-containing protein
MRLAVLASLALLASPALAADKAPAAGRRVEIKVTDAGFEPREVKLRKGEAATLVFTRLTDATCIKAVDIPDENVKKLELRLNKPASVTITPKKAGVEAFHCSAMGMGNGRLVVED